MKYDWISPGDRRVIAGCTLAALVDRQNDSSEAQLYSISGP